MTLQLKKGVVQSLAKNWPVVHAAAGGTLQLYSENFKMSLNGEDYIYTDIAVKDNALVAGAVVNVHFYSQGIYLGYVTETLGSSAVNTTKTSILQVLPAMARAEYCIVEVLFVKSATLDYSVDVLSTALASSETSVIEGTNVPASASFTIGTESVADRIIVSCQLKDVLGAALSEAKQVYYAVCSDAAGKVPAAIVNVIASGATTVQDEVTANATGLACTSATGLLALDLEAAAGAHDYYLLVSVEGKRFVSPIIHYAA